MEMPSGPLEISSLQLRIEVRAEGAHVEVNSQEGQLIGPDAPQIKLAGQSQHSSSPQNLSPPMVPDLSSISTDSPPPSSIHT